MKTSVVLLFVIFNLLFYFPSIAKALPEGIIIDKSEDIVIVQGFLNVRYFRKPTNYAVVYRGGFNAKRALFIAHASPVELYEALTEIGAVPGDNLSLDSNAGIKTEGSLLNVYITWEGADEDYYLERIILDNKENEFDIRFSGNIEVSEEVSSGCLLCLDSCPVGITGNARWGNRAYDHGKVFYRVNQKLLPPNGTPVKIIFELEEE